MILILVMALMGCEGSSYQRERDGLIKEYDVDFAINSIRLDDDAEYHIMAVSPNGVVETIKDERNDGYNITIRYRDCKKPILRKHYSNRNNHDYYSDEGVAQVLLPFGYKVETFDD